MPPPKELAAREHSRSPKPASPGARLLSSGQPKADCPSWRARSPPRQQPLAPGKHRRPPHPGSCRPRELPLSTPGSRCLRSGSRLTGQGRTSAFQLTPGWGGEEGGGVCVMCVHIGMQCYATYASACVPRPCLCSVAFFLLCPSPHHWGWAPSPSPSLPPPAPPILGSLSIHPSLSLGSSRHPSAPAPSYLRNRPGSRKAMTVQQLVGGREHPAKPDSVHCGSLSSASGGAQTLPSGAQRWARAPSAPAGCPPC